MIYSFLYVLAISFGLVFIQKLDASLPPLFSLLVTSIIATLYFNLINVKKLKIMYVACLEHKRLWIPIMVTILVMWSCTMISPGLIGASLFNFVYYAWLGALGFLSLSFQDWNKNKIKFYFALCLLALVAINIFFVLDHNFSRNIILGILLSLIGGISSFVYFKQSQALIKAMRFSATQILAVRFYLTIIVLLIILPKHNIVHYFTLSNLVSLIVLAALSLIIPLYFSQKALEHISSEQHAIINSLCPILTGIIQEVTFKDLAVEQIIIYVVYSLIMAGVYFINRYSNKKGQTL